MTASSSPSSTARAACGTLPDRRRIVRRSDFRPNCPQCGSQDLRIVPYDYGTCSQTGYRDAGERWECRTCGAVGDGDELNEQQARRRPSTESIKKTVQDITLFLGETLSLGCEPLRKDHSARNRMNQEKGQTTMNEIVKLPINTPGSNPAVRDRQTGRGPLRRPGDVFTPGRSRHVRAALHRAAIPGVGHWGLGPVSRGESSHSFPESRMKAS